MWVNIIDSHGCATDYQIQETIDKWPVLMTHASSVKIKRVLPADIGFVGTLRYSRVSHMTLLSGA